MSDIPSTRPGRDDGPGDEQSLARAISRWLKELMKSRSGESSVREAIEEIIEERGEETPIDSHERLLLGNILHMRDVTAHDVMVPRADIVSVDVATPIEQVIDMMARQGHSRMPVYRGTLDDVLGMIHIKDVVAVVATRRPVVLQHLLRRILFVAPSIRVLDLMLEMRLKRTHMALVVDEYGGIDGLVTIEDLVEEIVGEIEDEHDTDVEPEFIIRPDGTAEADARVPVEAFEERVGQVLSEDEREDTDTLGGLIFYLAGRVPTRGELITHSSGIEFQVMDADPRRVRRLRLRNLPPRPGEMQ
ncbi:MAG: hemolysin family protein [Alphaproteobacteria bacterium]